MLRKIVLSTFVFIMTSIIFIWSVDNVHAQSNSQCLGSALAEYMNTVIDITNTCGLDNVVLLSPAFNMTNNVGIPIISSATASNAQWGSLSGIAGNSYDYQTQRSVLQQIQDFMTGANGAGLPTMPIFLTETGVFRDGDPERFRGDLSQIKTGNAAGFDFLGAAFFAVFEDLGGSEWADDFNLDDSTIQYYCGEGGCNERIGFNSATYFGSVDSSYYERARNIPMGTTVSLTNLDPADIQPIVDVVEIENFTPVVRVGDATRDSIDGLEADTYGNFLCQLDDSVNGTVYAIAGPNEPQSECWFAPECGCSVDNQTDRDPLTWDDGFWLGKYPCDETADPEFHNFRPYPASPCDPLIPRSNPEAPNSPREDGDYGAVPYEDLEKGTWKKYLNYACGTNITYSTIGTFDPYGRDCDADPDSCYVYSDLDTNRDNPFLLQVCDRSEWDPDTGGPVTCYMTLKFRIRMDFSDTQVGILGNTQRPGLTSAQKVNNYLAYYWAGIPNWGGTTWEEVCEEPEEFEPADPPEANGCSGITYDFESDPADPDSSLSVIIRRRDTIGDTCNGNWDNVGLMYDGTDNDNTGITIRTDVSPFSYNGTINNTGSEGNHSVTLTLNDGSCICNSGEIQVGTPDPPECEYEAVDVDEDHIINYSGPIRKLMPVDAQNAIKDTIIDAREEEVHDYLVEDGENGPDDGITGQGLDHARLSDFDGIEQLWMGSEWPNVPLSSMEDMAGEVFFTGSFTGGPVAAEDPDSDLTTAPYQFNVTCAVGAHEECP